MMLNRALPKYWAIFKTEMINSLAYPADLASRGISILLFMWVFLNLWKVTYSAAGKEAIAGLTLRETLWYLMLTETITLSAPRISRKVAEAVKEGAIAYLLNKPYNFLLYQLSTSLGGSLLQMVLNALAGGTLVWISVGPPPPPSGWPLVLAAIVMAWLISFCINAMIGLLAFLTEEIAAFEWIYSKFILILGGVLIPLDFFPDWLRSIALALPFAYTTYGPARLFVSPTLENFTALFLRQSAWLLILGAFLGIFFKRSINRLAINGG